MLTTLRPRATLRSFLREEHGNITIYSVFMLVLILSITGASVDIMRYEANRVIMQSTMDRAVLAAADLDQTIAPKLVVEDYLAKSPVAAMPTVVKVESALNSRTVHAVGTAKMDTLFLKMSGIDKLTTPAEATAEEKIANVEISLVLDVSASMSNNLRMPRAKTAAQGFVNKVMSEDSNGVTTLNLVPFAGHVNPGTVLFDHFNAERPDIPGSGDSDGDSDDDVVDGDNNGDGDGSSTDVVLWQDDGNYFPRWFFGFHNVMLYFDTKGNDDVYDRVFRIDNFPHYASRDMDDMIAGAVAYAVAQDPNIDSTTAFLGASIQSGFFKRYYQVKGDTNGNYSDIGPTKNDGRIYDDTSSSGKKKKKKKNKKLVGKTANYSDIDFDAYAPQYISPNTPADQMPGAGGSGGGSGDDDTGSGTDDGTGDVSDETNINMPNSCIEIYDQDFLTVDMPNSGDYVPHFNMWGPYYNPPNAEHVIDFGWCPDEDTSIQYYSDDREGLVDFIGDLRMYDGTGLQYGMKYALSMLNPDNRDKVDILIDEGIVAEKFRGRPIQWNDGETEKYIVLMTDGQITDQNRPTNPTDPRNNTYSLDQLGNHAYSSFSPRENNVSNFKKQCDLAKSKGVIVFAVAFETNSTATNDLAYCASSPSHFFHVRGEDINDAFDTIARQINNLRLIQ